MGRRAGSAKGGKQKEEENEGIRDRKVRRWPQFETEPGHGALKAPASLLYTILRLL